MVMLGHIDADVVHDHSPLLRCCRGRTEPPGLYESTTLCVRRSRATTCSFVASCRGRATVFRAGRLPKEEERRSDLRASLREEGADPQVYALSFQ